jgi:uncharacterized protein
MKPVREGWLASKAASLPRVSGLLAILVSALAGPLAAQGQPLRPLPIPTMTPQDDVALAPPPNADLAFGAYQRGLYVRAFLEATRRLRVNPDDAPAMTLLGELYAQGLGVAQDWTQAGEWYRVAADRGDGPAAFALAMQVLDGRGVAKDPAAGRRLLEQAAGKGLPGAQYNLGLLLLRDRTPEADRRAADLFRQAAIASDVDAQYALAVLYKEGRGVEKDMANSALWMGRAAQGRSLAAQTEFAIMLFNGEGVAKDEAAAANLFRTAAERGSAVAQNRLARLYAAGRALPRDLVLASQWHSLSQLQGASDTWLDESLRIMTPAEREQAAVAAQRWLMR